MWSEKGLNWMATATCVTSAFSGITLSKSSRSTPCSMSQAHYPGFTCFASKKNANKLNFMDQILDYIEGTSFSPWFDYLGLARILQVLCFLFSELFVQWSLYHYKPDQDSGPNGFYSLCKQLIKSVID